MRIRHDIELHCIDLFRHEGCARHENSSKLVGFTTMDSQNFFSTEPDYVDSNAEVPEESDSEQLDSFRRIPTKGKRKISRPVQPVLDQEANEQESSPQCSSRSGSDRRNYNKLSKKVPKRKWTSEEITHLIECLENYPCLWDVFDKAYHMKDKREKALSEMSNQIEIEVMEIKTKINGLRTQLGRELAKVKKTKSGQGTDELYKPNWAFWEQLQFLCPVMTPRTSKDTIVSSDCTEVGFHLPSKAPKKSMDLKKQELLSTCIDILKEPPEKADNLSHFALFVDEKLKAFDCRSRMIAEKRITDVLFDLEINGAVIQPQHDYACNSGNMNGYSIGGNNSFMNFINQ